MVNAWYEPEPQNDGYLPTIEEIGAAVMVVLGALAWIYVARVCRRPL